MRFGLVVYLENNLVMPAVTTKSQPSEPSVATDKKDADAVLQPLENKIRNLEKRKVCVIFLSRLIHNAFN